ncbi:MAG: hypothetical protein Q4P18_07780 [Methanobrevibacter sp.]|uniref:hypothetical protein n=1 Tax=Methanobrevibacter sp. TaxID=66852 RepID=UPI0026E08300|nr:hypothetical protein [Methanobrevibacter sp.]MDO5849419.1 hypothetical protein [Methanobrevibacter sp.]
MNLEEVKNVFSKCFREQQSCKIAIKLKSGTQYETYAGNCIIKDERIRFPIKDEKTKVYHNVDIDSIQHIRAYTNDWSLCKRLLRFKHGISMIPEIWGAIK